MKNKLSYFYKVLILFLITVLSTSCILTVFSARQLSDSLKSKAWADYQSGLRKNAQTWTDLVSEIGQLYQAITLEPQTENFFSMAEFDAVQDYKTYLRVKKMYNINPFVTAICLYNEIADYALYCGTDSIPLAGLWEQMAGQNGKLICLDKRTDNGEEILILGYPVYMDSFDRPQGGIFVALNKELTATHIFGERTCRQMIFHRDGALLLSGEENAPLLKAIFEQVNPSEETCNEIISIEGKKYLCSTYRQEDTFFVRYEEEKAFMLPLSRQRNIFLLVCLLVMAISACLQFLIAKKLYSPIASLRETFSKSRFADGTAMGEFELIQQVYEKALDQVQTLEAQNASYLSRLKADTLRRLLTGSIEPVQAKEIFREHHLEIPFSGMFLASIQIDCTPEDVLTRGIVQTGIRKCLLSELSSLFYVEAVPVYNNEVIGLINTKEDGNATFEDLVKGLEKIRDALLSDYDIMLTIGLDGVISEMEDCRPVYARVRQLQKNRFALGDNQVIYPTRVMELLPKPLSWPEPLMKEVLAAFRKGDRKLFEQKAADFMDTISQYEYGSASLMFARLSLEMAAGWQLPGAGENIPAMEIKMNPATRGEAMAILQEAFSVFEERKQDAEQLKGNRHYKKIMESQEFIMTNYSDCNLSVDMIADRLGYSSNYFARQFKSITGFYVNDYIRQIRIMKAQDFLNNSSMTVNEISKATGFTTPNYFYSIFKKETGMTPASFRERMETAE